MDMIINRIAHYAEIGIPQFQELLSLPHRIETREAGQDIVNAGETVDYVFIVETGWAIRYQLLDDGRRQIVNFMLPGDCFDLMSLTKAKSDHSVSAATQVMLRRIKSDDFLKTIKTDPKLATAFWWVAIQEETILREQIVRNGRMSAKERVASLILELSRRLSISTGEQDNSLHLPVPRTHLADALGLSVVHVSRTLAWLKREGFIAIDPGMIHILRRNDMAVMAEFDDRHLHINKLKY